jgi:CDGSH-type Zn-finger protein
MQMPTTITVRQNGSYKVEGDEVKVVDWNGNPFPTPQGRPFALCRCGASKNKPFCDKSHLEIGFQAADPAPVPVSEDKPPISG